MEWGFICVYVLLWGDCPHNMYKQYIMAFHYPQAKLRLLTRLSRFSFIQTGYVWRASPWWLRSHGFLKIELAGPPLSLQNENLEFVRCFHNHGLRANQPNRTGHVSLRLWDQTYTDLQLKWQFKNIFMAPHLAHVLTWPLLHPFVHQLEDFCFRTHNTSVSQQKASCLIPTTKLAKQSRSFQLLF